MVGRPAGDDDHLVDLRQRRGEEPISSSRTRPVSSEVRPSRVSRTTSGCSKISLSMKCLKPRFSIISGFQEILSIFFSIGRPAKSENVAPDVSRTAISPSSRKAMSGVWLRMGLMSEEQDSRPPEPDHGRRPGLGDDDLARIVGRRARRRRRRPRARPMAVRTASSSEPRKCFSSRWAMTSVSVSVRKTWPSVARRSFRARGNSR